jgi:putative membrane protein
VPQIATKRRQSDGAGPFVVAATCEAIVMDLGFAPFMKTVVASLVYSLVGVAVFALSFLVIKAVTPFSIRKEIEEDHNTALAIVIGSVILGISLIISAAIHG